MTTNAHNETRGLFHEKENDKWYVATQLEAIYARRVFPCYDEPSFKTPWQITLHIPRGVHNYDQITFDLAACREVLDGDQPMDEVERLLLELAVRHGL